LSGLLLAGTRGAAQAAARAASTPHSRGQHTHPLSAWPQRRSLSAAD